MSLKEAANRGVEQAVSHEVQKAMRAGVGGTASRRAHFDALELCLQQVPLDQLDVHTLMIHNGHELNSVILKHFPEGAAEHLLHLLAHPHRRLSLGRRLDCCLLGLACRARQGRRRLDGPFRNATPAQCVEAEKGRFCT